jgi:mRNA interferase HigB
VSASCRHFWENHSDSEQALRAWYDEAVGANWQTPNEIKAQYKSASVVGRNRVVFGFLVINLNVQYTCAIYTGGHYDDCSHHGLY